MYCKNMSDVIKFTESEMQSIAKLQSDYQQNIYMLGQIDLEKTDLEQQLQELQNKRNEIFDNWKKLQQEESNLLNSLSQKYGDGSLNLKDGTFKPIPKQ
jgi:predicted nuclease with TOPRIM domain